MIRQPRKAATVQMTCAVCGDIKVPTPDIEIRVLTASAVVCCPVCDARVECRLPIDTETGSDGVGGEGHPVTCPGPLTAEQALLWAQFVAARTATATRPELDRWLRELTGAPRD